LLGKGKLFEVQEPSYDYKVVERQGQFEESFVGFEEEEGSEQAHFAETTFFFSHRFAHHTLFVPFGHLYHFLHHESDVERKGEESEAAR